MAIQNEPKVIALTGDQIGGIKKLFAEKTKNDITQEQPMTNAEMILGGDINANIETQGEVSPVIPEPPVVSEPKVNPIPNVNPLPEIPEENPSEAIIEEKVTNITNQDDESKKIVESINLKLKEIADNRSAMELLFNKSEVLEKELLSLTENLQNYSIGSKPEVVQNNPLDSQPVVESQVNSVQPPVQQPEEIVPFSNDFNVSGAENIFDVPSAGMTKAA